jgi:hypothetical protein
MKFMEPPSFLEPNPQLFMYHPTTTFSFDLFKPRPTRIHVNKQQQQQHQHSHHQQQQQQQHHINHHHTISPIIKTNPTITPPAKKPASSSSSKRLDNKKKKRKSSIEVDQSMFLTKNAHIKRPRNAWIHVRKKTKQTKNLFIN